MYTAVIVGCGSIGAMKPDKFDSPITKEVLTHAHAIYNNPNLKILGMMDVGVDNLKRAANKWNTREYSLGLGNPDIVVIATPTDTHLEVLNRVLEDMNPKIIIGEKPLGNSYLDCQRIIDRAGDIPIAVNYIRRYEPRHQEAASAMHHVSQGKGIYGCRVLYGRGLMHDGCHALDLMNWWFGKMVWATKTNGIKEKNLPISDGFVASYEGCPQVVFTPVDSKRVGVFEIDVISAIGKYALKNNGTKIELRATERGDDWGDYPVLGRSTSFQKTKLTNAMEYLYQNVVNFLNGREELKCTDQDALNVWKAYNKIQED